MKHVTEAGQHWAAMPSSDGQRVAFGFGDHRTVLDIEGQPYQSFLLHRVTAAEARAIAAELLATADALESEDQ